MQHNICYTSNRLQLYLACFVRNNSCLMTTAAHTELAVVLLCCQQGAKANLPQLVPLCVLSPCAAFGEVKKRVRTTAGGSTGSVRNLRIREDTAKYLLNLDTNSAHYDPKSRSMREDPNPNRVSMQRCASAQVWCLSKTRGHGSGAGVSPLSLEECAL
jgi:hypothetical protein